MLKRIALWLVLWSDVVVAAPVNSMLGADSAEGCDYPGWHIDARLEYLVCTNNAYIAFDWYINELSGFEVDWCKTERNYYTSLFTTGLDTDYSSSPYTFSITYSDGGPQPLAYAINSSARTNATYVSGYSVKNNTWHTLEYINDTGEGEFAILADGEVRAIGTSFHYEMIRSSIPLTFLAKYKSGRPLNGTQGYWTGSIYEIGHAAFYRNGALWNDLYPVRFTNEAGESEVGFWDEVQEKVWRAQRGEFLGGPDVAE